MEGSRRGMGRLGRWKLLSWGGCFLFPENILRRDCGKVWARNLNQTNRRNGKIHGSRKIPKPGSFLGTSSIKFLPPRVQKSCCFSKSLVFSSLVIHFFLCAREQTQPPPEQPLTPLLHKPLVSEKSDLSVFKYLSHPSFSLSPPSWSLI